MPARLLPRGSEDDARHAHPPPPGGLPQNERQVRHQLMSMYVTVFSYRDGVLIDSMLCNLNFQVFLVGLNRIILLIR